MAVLIEHSRVSHTREVIVEALRRQAQMVEGTGRRVHVFVNYLAGYEDGTHIFGYQELLDLADHLESAHAMEAR